MRGCVAEPLGLMRYRCMAAPALIAQWAPGGGAVQPHQLLAQRLTQAVKASARARLLQPV